MPAAGGQNTELVTNAIPGGNPLDEEVDWQSAPTGAAPTTRIVKAHIDKRKHTTMFAFQATGPATSYRCALRLAKRRPHFTDCASPKTYKHLKAGSYTFEVTAADPGEPYRAAAKKKLKIA